jgi:hypothetical protein
MSRNTDPEEDTEREGHGDGEEAGPYDARGAAGQRKKPGPVPGPPTQRYTVLLDEASAEWGKRQPGGLSELLRRLLREAQETQEGREGTGTRPG